MSTVQSPPGKDPGTLQSTRQMLDDLDALMNRMLAIPVNDLDDAAMPPRELASVSPMSATLTVLEPAAGEEKNRSNEARTPARAIAPNYITPKTSALDNAKPLPTLVDPSFLMTLPQNRDETFERPIPEEVIPQSILTMSAPILKEGLLMAPVLRPRRSFVSIILLPLVWFNRGFDKIASFLGRPGKWVSGARGRNILGWTGLLLMGAAGLLFVKDWFGWTW